LTVFFPHVPETGVPRPHRRSFVHLVAFPFPLFNLVVVVADIAFFVVFFLVPSQPSLKFLTFLLFGNCFVARFPFVCYTMFFLSVFFSSVCSPVVFFSFLFLNYFIRLFPFPMFQVCVSFPLPNVCYTFSTFFSARVFDFSETPPPPDFPVYQDFFSFRFGRGSSLARVPRSLLRSMTF